MIEFEGEFELDRPPEALWDYFTDPDVLAECAPGVEEMTVGEPWEVETVLSVKVGSVNPSFDCDVTVTRAEFPEQLEMVARGDASRNAFEAGATMDLQETDDGGTVANWTARAEVSGLLASLGQRALGGVTERLVNNFFEDLEAMAEDGVPAESKLEGAPEEDVDLDELDADLVETEET
ncbi:carbon monoxide dehydrogenase [Halobacteriales archaeon QS_1_68_20]|nr:MAG: carbon monoxide dehydrogenase [Halobacteriales archaeon QS_1_68_20]